MPSLVLSMCPTQNHSSKVSNLVLWNRPSTGILILGHRQLFEPNFLLTKHRWNCLKTSNDFSFFFFTMQIKTWFYLPCDTALHHHSCQSRCCQTQILEPSTPAISSTESNKHKAHIFFMRKKFPVHQCSTESYCMDLVKFDSFRRGQQSPHSICSAM